MLKRLAVIFAAGVALVALGYTQQPKILKLTVDKASAFDGKQMFVNYCAPCHGLDGKGNGPVTSSLVLKPVDITMLTSNNGGKFPWAHFAAVIQFGSESPAAHGIKDMPSWGPFLKKVDHQLPPPGPDILAVRIKNLNDYVRTLQVK